jgi:hypothetical protein
MERDARHEQQPGGGRREQPFGEQGRQEKRRHAREPGDGTQHRLGRRKQMDEKLADCHEAERPDGVRAERQVDEPHRPRRLVFPKADRTDQEAARSEDDSQDQNQRRRERDGARRRNANPRSLGLADYFFHSVPQLDARGP